MPSGLQPDGSFLCKPCKTKFSSWEQLLKHKENMQRAGKDKHIHCKFCGQDFKTEAGLMRHIHEASDLPPLEATTCSANMTQFHAQAQNLQCPGCHKGPFVRLGGLMSHIQNECPTLDVSFLEHLREEKMEFAMQLQAQTKEPVKANYGQYMPAASGAGNIVDVERSIETFKLKKKEFPALSASKSTDNRTDHSTDNKENIAPWEWNGKPTKEQLDKAAAPAPENWDEYLNVNDPAHPNFNVARYYSSIIEKYSCPVIGCGKTFKTSHAIIGHIKSPAHSRTKYRCPYCLRTFKALADITQHAESSSVRCRMRETDTYGALVDQLTGGLADVSISRHDDGTVKYEVSTKFCRKDPEPPKPEPPKHSGVGMDEDPWTGTKIIW
ncbi:hypothetical protein ACHAPT_003921 [Fusarium lateritium]